MSEQANGRLAAMTGLAAFRIGLGAASWIAPRGGISGAAGLLTTGGAMGIDVAALAAGSG
jgi:hypothetical protein